MKKRVILFLIIIFITLIKVNAIDCQFSDWSMPGLQQDNTIVLDQEIWNVNQYYDQGALVRVISKPRPGPIEGYSIISDDQAIQNANDFLERNRATLGIPGPTGFENFQGYVTPINIAYLNNDYFVYVERQYCGPYPVIGTYTSVLMTDDATPYKIEFRWYVNINVNTGNGNGEGGGAEGAAPSILPKFNPDTNTTEFVLTDDSYTPTGQVIEEKPEIILSKYKFNNLFLIILAIIILIIGIVLWKKLRT